MGDGVGFYWRYEKALRRLESEVGSMLGATGAIYALRRALWQPLPPGTILDDVLAPMRAVLAGSRVCFEPRAQAFDYTPPDASTESRRKIRTLAGNVQILWFEPRLLVPFVNPVWLQYSSHKVGRLLVPYALMTLLASSIILLRHVALLCVRTVRAVRLLPARRIRRVARALAGGPPGAAVGGAAHGQGRLHHRGHERVSGRGRRCGDPREAGVAVIGSRERLAFNFGGGTVPSRRVVDAAIARENEPTFATAPYAEPRDWGYAGLLAFTLVLMTRPQDTLPFLDPSSSRRDVRDRRHRADGAPSLREPAAGVSGHP